MFPLKLFDQCHKATAYRLPMLRLIQVLKLLLQIVNQAIDVILDGSRFWSKGT